MIPSEAHPFLSEQFEIPWSELTPERVEPDIRAAIRIAEEALEQIRAIPAGQHTFENTLLALEAATEPLSRAWTLVGHLESVNQTPELRKAYNQMLPEVTAFFSKLPLDPALWAAVQAFARTDQANGLTGVERRFLEETLADFVECGADLAENDRERLLAINHELAKLTQQYGENVLDSTNAWTLLVEDPERLRGLPESSREEAREDALARGLGTEEKPVWRFTQQMTSVLPVLQYVEDESLRREVWEGSTTIGRTPAHDNTGLIRQILQLRREKAQLLGRADFADLVTARRMARNGSRALAFVEDLHQRCHAAFERDFAELETHQADLTNQPRVPLEPWSTAFLSESLRRLRYDLDEEALRPYFPLPQVKNGLFALAQKLFGIRITPRSTRWVDPNSGEVAFQAVDGDPSPDAPVDVWHPEVRYYTVSDLDGTHLGAFYADWHPRESKRGGAWMNSLRTGGPLPDGGFAPHLGLICGNMSRPSSRRPALLTHREVETIFHEFGHLLHHLLSRVGIHSLAGTHVAWDFVELPSQIMENWCWEREALDLFARHYETGEPIPDALFQQMLAARNFQQGAFSMRQLSLGKLDLELHRYPERYAEGDLDELLAETLADYSYPYPTRPPSIVRRFSHLFSSPTGYAAGYYSYKWAEVLEADAFTRFQAEGILNPEVGRQFRQSILERGNSAPPESLFRDFLGRDPDPEALMRRSGL